MRAALVTVSLLLIATASVSAPAVGDPPSEPCGLATVDIFHLPTSYPIPTWQAFDWVDPDGCTWPVATGQWLGGCGTDCREYLVEAAGADVCIPDCILDELP